MEVHINLYGEVKSYLPAGKKSSFSLRVPEGTAVRDILDYLKVPAQAPLAVVVNGAHHDSFYRVVDSDVLSIFSMAAFADPEASP